MTKPENKQPQLSCQELSKQCNDINSSSSEDLSSPLSHPKKMVRRNLFAVHHRKLSSPSSHPHVWKQQTVSNSERSLHNNLSATHMYHEDWEDNDDNDDEIQDADTTHRRRRDYTVDCEWGSPPRAVYSLSQNNQDFLDDIESTVHWQVDDEIDVFRSNLHSIIRQQQHSQCRHLLASPGQDESLSQTPSHTSVYHYREKNSSPSQTVPLASESEDTCTWSSDVIHNFSDQQRLEAMSTSTSSLQGEDGATQFVSTSGKDGPSLDSLLNRLTIQLLASALCISNTMQREEYAT